MQIPTKALRKIKYLQRTGTSLHQCEFIQKFFKRKQSFQKVFRTSSIVFDEVQKESEQYSFSSRYWIKAIEVALCTELLFIPFLQNKEEQFLLNECIVYFFEKDGVSNLKTTKFKVKIIAKVLLIVLKRIIVPLLIKECLVYFNRNFFHIQC